MDQRQVGPGVDRRLGPQFLNGLAQLKDADRQLREVEGRIEAQMKVLEEARKRTETSAAPSSSSGLLASVGRG